MSWAARGAVDDWAARGAAGWAGPLVGRLDGLGGWMGDRPVAAAGGAHLHSVPRQHIRGLSLGILGRGMETCPRAHGLGSQFRCLKKGCRRTDHYMMVGGRPCLLI